MYPALAVLKAITKDAEAILWVGGKRGIEAGLIQREGLPFEAIPAAGIHGVGLRALPGNLLRLGQGLLASRRLLKDFKPDVLFFTGGYVAFPMALAGWNIPSVLYVPDIEPGLALKSLSRFSRAIALTTADSQAYFPANKQMTVTGYPIRPELAHWTRENARQTLNLQADLPTLLVFGGSLGARSINRALLHHVGDLLQQVQIVHITGNLDWEEVQAARKALPSALMERYHTYAYLHEEMGAALAAADLVISRAGASILGEFPYFGLPAILVPYPHAWRYQKINAEYLQKHGAAILVKDEELSDHIYGLVNDLISQPEKLQTMKDKMLALSHPDAARRIAEIILNTAGSGGKHGRA
ncbi:MAG: UDP-N-acetylglucosamine--N-acetylmuramyl-(pentapeptide) pyrophosphoryl-undecaprenol N-acetylglucosamine transferase [Anaerolineae bacterium]|nr:UDP-N-acetylglucosamine--N-acetylmuramyl-(pentapeptide) pyrophosphoryl-undecaprenol N-acetylglucosamine transferase [Anaerolineae bacterium]